MWTAIGLLLLILLLSPITMLLTSRILRVDEATLTKCIMISFLLSLVGSLFTLLFDYLFPEQQQNLIAFVWLIVSVFIVSWQLNIGMIRAVGLTLLWSILLPLIVAIIFFPVVMRYPAQTEHAMQTWPLLERETDSDKTIDLKIDNHHFSEIDD